MRIIFTGSTPSVRVESPSVARPASVSSADMSVVITRIVETPSPNRVQFLESASPNLLRYLENISPRSLRLTPSPSMSRPTSTFSARSPHTPDLQRQSPSVGINGKSYLINVCLPPFMSHSWQSYGWNVFMVFENAVNMFLFLFLGDFDLLSLDAE